MNPSDIEKALADIEAQRNHFDELAKAYKIVAEDLKRRSASTTSTEYAPIRRLILGKGGVGKTTTVRNAIEAINTPEFTLEEVFEMADIDGGEPVSRNDVSFILSRLRKAEEIFVVKKGAGKSPSVYSKKNPNDLPL